MDDVALVTKWCLALWDPVDCNSPVSSAHGILQARILEWVAFPSSRILLQDLPNPGIECMSPPLEADSLPAEPEGKPRILEWITYPFSSGFSNPGIKLGSPAGRFFTN